MNLNNITLDEALGRAKPGLRCRMEKSVELLHKAEKLAFRYDPENGYSLAFSGGKDSQALYHIAELAGVRFQAVFSPTTVDPPQVIRFIRRQYPDVVFRRPRKSIYDVAREKKMMPTKKMRWCCAEFKEGAGAGKVVLTGVRHAESVKRRKRKEVEVSNHKFAGDLDGFEQYRIDRLKKQYKNLNQDEFARVKESEVRCINGKDGIIINPLIEWTDSDVWQFLNDVCRVPHCELYDPPYNQRRIGCILCPMSSKKSKRRDCELFPHVKQKWIEVFEDYLRGGIYQRIQERIRGGTELRPAHSRWGKDLLIGGSMMFAKPPKSYSIGG